MPPRRTAVAAPAAEPNDTCNWLPLKVMLGQRVCGPVPNLARVKGELCGAPCVEEISVRVAGQAVLLHYCAEHQTTRRI